MIFRATKNSCFVFRATRKSMLKVIRATRKSMPQFQGPIFFGNLGFEPNVLTKLEKNKNDTLINALIGSIFWNKNISCHDTFKPQRNVCQIN